MKTCIAVRVIVLLLLVVSCSPDSKSSDFSKSPGVDNFTSQDRRDYLEVMSNKLALNGLPTALSKAEVGNFGLLNKSLLSRFLKEDQINLSEIAPDETDRIVVNGRVHRVKVEIFNTTTLEKMLKSSGDENGIQFGVYPDPALYWQGDDKLDFPVQIVSRDGEDYSSQDQVWTAPYASDIDDIDDEFNAYVGSLRSTLEYPIFAVTSEEIDDENGENSNPFTRGLEKSASGNGYLTLLGIRLYVTRDGLTKDEFESWYNELNIYDYNLSTGPGVVNGQPGYRWKHNDNGDDRTTDAGGNSVKLQDVNADHIWYDQSTPFRLVALGDVRLILPFDDDHNGGEMSRDNTYTGTNQKLYDKNDWKSYDPGDSTVTKNLFYYRVDNDLPQTGDEDDRYGEGAIWRISAAAIKTATQDGARIIDTKSVKKNGVITEDGLPDMRWKLGWIEF